MYYIRPKRYRVKEEPIEAMEFSNYPNYPKSFKESAERIAKWCGGRKTLKKTKKGDHCYIVEVPTLDGILSLEQRQVLIKNLNTGAFYIMDNREFHEKYQEIGKRG